MKKIININLSGRVIPIEDSAYEELQSYIESLRRYFSNEEGRDEIINDIESRIAELMNDKVRKGTDAITDADIEEIISSMGRVEDFEAADKEADAAQPAGNTQSERTTYTSSKKGGRLYRDSGDKIIGGVCSGIASYLNIDPSIIRILFAIITFGGFGFGILIYVILWMVLPPKELEGFSGKKLYRNPDDKILGGVAGGLAAYFGRSSKTIRLIFVAPLILSVLLGILNNFRWDDFDFALNIGFGSLSGTFILVYVILWMVLSEATSDYQKMEMRGETVDVNRIRQNVREGMDSMKGRMQEWGAEVKESAQNFGTKAKEFAGTRGKAFASEVKETAARSGSGFGHAIGVLFKVFFLFIAGTIAFALFVSLIALLFGGVAWWPINDFLWTSNWQQTLAWLTLILFFVVPLVGFIVWLIRRITRARSKSNYLSWTFGGLWAFGWVVGTFFVVSIVRDFREYEHVDIPVTLTQPLNNKLIVAVSKPELEYTGRFGWMRDGSDGWDLEDDSLKIAAVKFSVKASPDSQYHVMVKKYGFGKTNEDAFSRAEKILFDVVSRDSILDIDNGYAIDSKSKFRFQNVEIEILVPPGKKIMFDESVDRKLNSMSIKVTRSNRRDRITGLEFHPDEDGFNFRTGIEYTMGINGELKAPEGVIVNPGNDYRYDGNTDSLELERSIERKKQELKELEEKKIKKQTIITTLKKITRKKNHPSYATTPTAPALTEWF